VSDDEGSRSRGGRTPDAFARDGHRIRAIDPGNAAEVELVAARMRQTLVEVLGDETGRSLYTMDWLIQRVRWHLDPAKSTAAVFLAETREGRVTGHTIVRIECDDAGKAFGLFSTTFVEPESRRLAVATQLLLRGEAWMRAHGMTEAATYTAETNAKLIGLYHKHGYAIVETRSEMVRLAKVLA
jgi:GNAT superfamily N-acetyltransferase